MSLSTTPRATARLQFNKGFTLDDAVALVPYFDALGISHLYASPLLTARPGSTHGYDVIDPTAINPELGGRAALQRLVAALRARRMGLLLDIVPNHMGVGAGNRWWQDVLEHGQNSAYAKFFDINFAALHGKILAPFLGAPYGETLRAGEITLRLKAETGRLVFAYHEHEFPLSPESAALVHKDAAGVPGFTTPARLHELLEQQHYRLAWWRTAADEINWRRFFDINTLAGMRVELPEVFSATHEYLLGLYADGLIDGVRIDHIDGLTNPGAYLRKLRREMARAANRRPAAAAQGPPYIVVEKILAPGEQLDARWRTNGTTGYDFMDQVGALLHDPAGAAPLGRLWEKLTGRSASFENEEVPARRQILRENLAAELTALATTLHELAQQDACTRDYTLTMLRHGLEEILVQFPAYRVYAGAAGGTAADARLFDHALKAAAQPGHQADAPTYALLRRWLLAEAPRTLPPGPYRRQRLRAMTGFQQLSAPTAAKSVEDTAFYRYGRLLSRNEVGSNPGHFCRSPAAFHEASAARGMNTPGALLATATHDHKRGEDTRARLAVLSELPAAWEQAVTRWTQLNAPLRATGPDAADEVMLYQMLVAGWPLTLAASDATGVANYAQRVAAWQQKSLREAKRHSGWAAPDEAYEAAATRFLYACLDTHRPVLAEIASFAARIAPAGAINGLAQTVLRLTVPGVPDLYQGTEFWDQSFVDPDNRREVDFAQRAVRLTEADATLAHWHNGAVKQAIIARGLGLRRAHPALFTHGTYEPRAATGTGAEAAHILAFSRRYEGAEMVVAVTRLAAKFALTTPCVGAEAWGETSLDLGPGTWRNILTGDEIKPPGPCPAATLLARLPVAILLRS